ncbi:adenosine deaminase [Nonomuraea sp. NPDC049784]|uniref:adenosine deaminase n=1 Tax=Nonomuraea sp. NPDC049784 TaxID=3154361 RepID=UPI0034042A7D
MNLHTLPKAELHLHLEGAIRPSTAAELADRYGLPAPPGGPFNGLSEFVVAYERARDLIGSLDDLHRVARELVEDAAAQGVVWTEVHVIPPTYAGRLGPAEGVLEAVLDGLRSGSSAASGAGVIVGVNRGLPLDQAERSLALAVAYRDQGVVGFGLAGDEARFPAAAFAGVFTHARDAGLAAVPHGGEGAGADSVRACVEMLGARRVNHGIRAVEDPALVAELAERQVCLDVCPSSNIELQVSPSLAEHPLPALMDAGVPVTVNSDCPLFCGSTLVEEYDLVRRWLDLDVAALAHIAETSLRFSSCPVDRLEQAMADLARWRG